ncbi:MAG: hypothetical protein JWN99_2785, partial [Ilumatobacteraceae bacterium]|nr:hypothetical protein [Ilumatobacteraceae bacterium]
NEPSSSAAPATDETRSFPSLGGSITVQLSNGQLHLLDVAPAAGYTLDHQDVNSDDIQVRFRSGDLESRIRVRIVGGQMQGTTEER